MYPFDVDNPTGPERNPQECMLDAIAATEDNITVCGHKGPSFLMDLPGYNLVRSTAIDYMHGVLLGVTKLLLGLWFGAAHNGKDFCLRT